LNYSDFESDAFVFKDLKSKRLTLENKSKTYALQFEFENFHQFGIWTKPQAPFLCLEPWNGFADSVAGQVEFKDKLGLIHLKSNETFSCQFSATFLMRV
jgi:galactose mutarotase-like enzyme